MLHTHIPRQKFNSLGISVLENIQQKSKKKLMTLKMSKKFIPRNTNNKQ